MISSKRSDLSEFTSFLADSSTHLSIEKVGRAYLIYAENDNDDVWLADSDSLCEAMIFCDLNWPSLNYVVRQEKVNNFMSI